ncbi:zinc finger protein ZFAT-like isoform X2 [Dunckerocampus dactyliophorus]|uniref:zinc finger protein ZFAT-like isoform X2 n=1 Tax=Dunckerocampus dactyliophorus TaxID=161453 RepID=UPI0024055A8E|nr:zinc finger protein ZFAT-like isoform X2 [Dunckerocampus dactyliophorus]
MDGQKTAGSVFMCRLCNLFSPTRSLLLAHCSEMHPLHEPNEDIIVALQPLARVPLETLTESPVKRKRGRPKGSTKKPRTDCTNTREDSAQGPLDKAQRQERQKEVADAHGGNDRISGLKCNDCHRLFSNRRQIVKHICLKAPDEEEEEEEEDGIGTRSFQRPRPNKKSRMLSDDGERHTSKEDSLATGSKKSVINVVLTEDDLLPGVTKMIPVENISTGADHVNIPGESQIQNTEATQGETTDIVSQSQPTPCDEDPKADQELSSDKATPPPGKGFQEYSIKQDAPNLLQSQLKVFACEFCNKIFKFRHSLISHLRTHTQEKPFKCPHCDYASAIKANLNVHLRKHTGEKFSCQQCPFQCLSPGHLKVHIERVHLKLKQHCSYCQKKYSDVKNLIKHFEKCHNLKDPLIYKSYQQLRLKTRQGLRQLLYHCPTCHRRFKNLLERERHLLVHGPQRPFACLLCEHAGTSLATLTAHVRKHPFLYVCCACEKKFVSCQRLKSHLTECHSDLEQEQVFTECIKNSFYLMSGAGSLSGDEEREDTERSKKLEDNSREEGRRNGDDGQEWREGEDEERENEGIQFQGEDVEAQRTSEGCTQKSEPKNIPEAQQCAVPSETNNMTDHNKQGHTPHMENTPTNPNTQLADDNTEVSSLLLAENKNLPSAPSGEDHQSPQSDKGLQLSAFQQVLSSLPKTHLDMETFQRLRKMYGDLECQYCGKLFWYKVHYNAHVRTHTKEHLHYCSKCNYSSITKSSLKRHLIQKHSGLLLTCSNPGCKYTTPDKYKLQAHRRTHQEECKSAPCPTCHQNYPEHRLRRHIQMSHPDTILVKGLMVKRAEKCPYCESYYLKNSSDFQQHIWAHQGVKPFVCNICDYASRSRNNLKNHMNRHNKERCHVCDLCGKTLKSKVSLKSHRLSHTDEGKRFRCPECDFTSALKAPLVRHMEQHAEFKPFRCAHCHYSCNTSGPLKRHYKTKHPDQKYQNVGKGFSDPEYSRQGGIKCPECRFVYGTKWELNRHLKKKHGPKQVECTWEVEETVETHFVPLEQEEQLTEENVAALRDNGPVNILQQIAEFNSETHDAITSMVAMAPGTVAVVEQVEGEKEVDDSQLMVVNADGDLTGEQVMVVEEGHGLEALTVLTQGDSNHHFIVYVQEQTVEIN